VNKGTRGSVRCAYHGAETLQKLYALFRRGFLDAKMYVLKVQPPPRQGARPHILMNEAATSLQVSPSTNVPCNANRLQINKVSTDHQQLLPQLAALLLWLPGQQELQQQVQKLRLHLQQPQPAQARALRSRASALHELDTGVFRRLYKFLQCFHSESLS
jgi:hypothetical protein